MNSEWIDVKDDLPEKEDEYLITWTATFWLINKEN